LCFEDPVAVVDIYAVINDDKSTKDCNREIRRTGHAIGEALGSSVYDVHTEGEGLVKSGRMWTGGGG
jgi:hypothetical protein